VIFYSLGNLVFDQFQRVETQRGALADVVFEGPRLARAGLLPVEIIGTAPRLAGAKFVNSSSGGSGAK
jgi:poly-gamma-glutamate capsule biosynthesis protein CapA/YwtB (metallophosphatase superfamily)